MLTADRPTEPAGNRDTVVRVVSANVPTRQRLADIWRYRQLLIGLTRKELRIKYKDSVLGFIWSLISPATTLLVYYVVFQIILKSNIPQFAIFLMCGVLIWNFFSVAVPAATGSVVANGGIIKKVAFPREIVALAPVGAALVHFFLQSIVMGIFLVAFWHGPAVGYLPLVVPALFALVLLASALGILLASVNVKLRDTGHLLDVGLQVWFWATPILVQYARVRNTVLKNPHSIYHAIWYLYRLNPVAPIVLSFQRAIYGKTSPRGKGGVKVPILPDHAGLWWYLWQDLLVIAFGFVLFWFALRVFSRFEGNFAEEL